MIDEKKLKNIFAFLVILFGEDVLFSRRLMAMSPCYVMEKWDRYMESVNEEHHWGIHPNLNEFFDMYMQKWGVNND